MMIVLFSAIGLVVVNAAQPLNEFDWTSVPMPTKSLYAGFEPPSDSLKWKVAQEQAAQGKQLLLQKVIDQVVYPGEIISGDIHFGWLHRMGDSFTSDKRPLEEELIKETSGKRAAITLIGYFDYTHMDGEGSSTNFYGYGPGKILEKYKNENFKLPKKIVGIGHMNENWGWLSTHMTNRSCTWGFGFSSDIRHSPISPLEQMKPFLDDPNLVMLLVNQHHNVSYHMSIHMQFVLFTISQMNMKNIDIMSMILC